MKLNKKMMAINVLATLLMTDVAMAGISGNRRVSTGSNQASSQPSTTRTTEASPDNFTVIKTTDMSSCIGTIDDEIYFPLDMFSQISRDDGAKVDIQIRPNNKIVVKIPPVLNVCGKFTPEIIQDTVTKNVTVVIKLIGTKKELVGAKGSGAMVETKDTPLTHKDFENCLIEKKIMVDGKIDYDKASGRDYTESVSTIDYEFDKVKDVQNTVTVSYGYPKSYNSTEGYPTQYGLEDRAPSVPGQKCMLSEKIAEDSTYINKGKQVILELITAACLRNNAQEIAQIRKSYGNAEALKDDIGRIGSILDAAYLNAVKSDVERINTEMTRIEDKLNKNRDTITESEAKKEITKYAALAKELDALFLNPAIYRLDTLMQKRASIDDDGSKEVEGIDIEIKKINEEIGQFSKRSQTSFGTVYETMEKYALTDSAKIVEDVRLKSHLYSRVYAGSTDEKRGPPLTFEKANQDQYKRIQAFEKSLNVWTDVYLVGKGNMIPIQRTERERQGAIDRMNSRYAAFEKKEMSDYRNYCSAGMLGSVKNPVKCKEFVNGRERRMNMELKKREKDLYFIKGKNDMLGRMGMSYNQYQRDLASKESSEADMYDPSGASYTSYEDNFSERFPGYYGPTSSSAYDASLYNLGGVSGSVNMGQMPMMISQQQQYNGQQGYQYQMPQQQQQVGAWPALQ